jgi:hypothetical protein
MLTDVFEIRLGQNVNMYTKRLGHLYVTKTLENTLSQQLAYHVSKMRCGNVIFT